VLEKQWQFTPVELPAVLTDITEWVYASLDVALTPAERAYIQDKNAYDYRAIEEFISLFSEYPELKGQIKRQRLNQLMVKYPRFPVLVIYALNNRVRASNLDEAYTNLERYKALQKTHKEHVGIEFESYLAMDIEVLPKHIVADRLKGMKKLVKDNPNDPQIMITLADQLVKNGNTLEAVTVMLEAVERWPGYYRAWWSLGWALNQHAWQVRGNSMWRDVPEGAKKRFKSLAHLSDRAIDEALTLNPYNARLWSMKISSMGSISGYSEELMAAFNKAVKLAPNERRIYDGALNFSADRWGGNTGARKHIIEKALENNPDSAWSSAMRSMHAADFEVATGRQVKAGELHQAETLLENPLVLMGLIFFIVVFLVLILAVVYLLGRSSQ
jgi:tetratricopeptide (TPR) repeat protein